MTPPKQAPFGTVTTGLTRLIRREIRARSETLVGTVLSVRRLEDVDANTSATWVVDVDVGAGETLRSVAVKAGSDGSRFYADLGQTVRLARNTQGRFDVIGPGDRVNAIAVRKTYKLGVPVPTATVNQGLQTQRVAFEFYEGPTSGTPGTSLWNDGVQGFPLIRVVDQDGNPV